CRDVERLRRVRFELDHNRRFLRGRPDDLANRKVGMHIDQGGGLGAGKHLPAHWFQQALLLKFHPKAVQELDGIDPGFKLSVLPSKNAGPSPRDVEVAKRLRTISQLDSAILQGRTALGTTLRGSQRQIDESTEQKRSDGAKNQAARPKTSSRRGPITTQGIDAHDIIIHVCPVAIPENPRPLDLKLRRLTERAVKTPRYLVSFPHLRISTAHAQPKRFHFLHLPWHLATVHSKATYNSFGFRTCAKRAV